MMRRAPHSRAGLPPYTPGYWTGRDRRRASLSRLFVTPPNGLNTFEDWLKERHVDLADRADDALELEQISVQNAMSAHPHLRDEPWLGERLAAVREELARRRQG